MAGAFCSFVESLGLFPKAFKTFTPISISLYL